MCVRTGHGGNSYVGGLDLLRNERPNRKISKFDRLSEDAGSQPEPGHEEYVIILKVFTATLGD